MATTVTGGGSALATAIAAGGSGEYIIRDSLAYTSAITVGSNNVKIIADDGEIPSQTDRITISAGVTSFGVQGSDAGRFAFNTGPSDSLNFGGSNGDVSLSRVAFTQVSGVGVKSTSGTAQSGTFALTDCAWTGSSYAISGSFNDLRVVGGTATGVRRFLFSDVFGGHIVGLTATVKDYFLAPISGFGTTFPGGSYGDSLIAGCLILFVSGGTPARLFDVRYTGLRVEGCTLRGLGTGAGSGTCLNVTNVTAEDILVNCDVGSFLIAVTANQAGAFSTHTNIYNVGTDYGGSAIAGIQDTAVDPQVHDESGGDFRITEDSPLRDAGTTALYPYDIQGYSRDATPDRGAYEWVVVDPVRDSSVTVWDFPNLRVYLSGAPVETMTMIPETDEPAGIALARAMWLSLGCHAWAEDSDSYPGKGTDDAPYRGGFVGDAVPLVDGDRFGSRLWTLFYYRGQDRDLKVAAEIKRCLQWMIDDGLAKSVDGAATIDGGRCDATARVVSVDGQEIRIGWDPWEGLR